MGMSLVAQLGKRLYLTEAGKEVLSASQEIFQWLTQLENPLNELRGMKKGQLSLVMTTAKYFVLRWLGACKKQHPAIDFQLNITNQGQVLDRLSRVASSCPVQRRCFWRFC
jgi:DNA-binding transcriptional LysR family regulator